jgi:hypothetical protein
MTDTASMKLVRPIRVEERMITEVTIRRPKVRDLRAMEKMREPEGTELDQGIAMAAALCDRAAGRPRWQAGRFAGDRLWPLASRRCRCGDRKGHAGPRHRRDIQFHRLCGREPFPCHRRCDGSADGSRW